MVFGFTSTSLSLLRERISVQTAAAALAGGQGHGDERHRLWPPAAADEGAVADGDELLHGAGEWHFHSSVITHPPSADLEDDMAKTDLVTMLTTPARCNARSDLTRRGASAQRLLMGT